MSDPDIAVIGVGLHPFGRHGNKSALEMGEEAGIEARGDAGVARLLVSESCLDFRPRKLGSFRCLSPVRFATTQQRRTVRELAG